MQERQVTVEGADVRLEPPFHVLATANPVEYEGTYPLPEAQLDRFLLRVSFGYPTGTRSGTCCGAGCAAARRSRRSSRSTDAGDAARRCRQRRDGDGGRELGRYCVALAAATREHPHVLIGASPRGALALLLTPGRPR